MSNMKRIISILILTLITAASFAQQKYVLKVHSAASVDLSGIYTKAQVDSINALSTANNGITKTGNTYKLGGTLSSTTAIGLGSNTLYIGQNAFSPNSNVITSNDGTNAATLSNNGAVYNTVIKNSVNTLGYGVANQIANDVNGIAIAYHKPFDNTGSHPQSKDSSNANIGLNGSGIQIETGGYINFGAKSLNFNAPFFGKYGSDSLFATYNPSNISLGSLLYSPNRNTYVMWTGSTFRPISKTLYPDDFTYGDDYGNIQHAINFSKDGDVIQLGNKTYVLERALLIKKSITLRGGDSTIITRPNAEITTLKEAADSSSDFIRVNNVSNFSSGDVLIVYSGNDWTLSTEPVTVRMVSGDTLFVDTLHKYRGGIGTFAIGTKVLKSIGFINIGSDSTESASMTAVTIENITFDGNKANNTESYRYNVNMPIVSETQKRTVIRGCKFINAPGENILGHNMDILSNIFKNNNGSIFHGSINKQWIRKNEFMTNIIGNISDSSNLISSNISGHSEGVLTTSNSGGFVNATGNRFLNIGSGSAVIGALYPSSTNQDWGTSNYNFSGNIVNGATRLVYLIDTSGGVSGTDSLKNVYIADNLLYNVGYTDYSKELKHWGRSVIINQKNNDDRDTLIVTTSGTSGPSTKVGNVLNIPNYAVSGGSLSWGSISGSLPDQGDLISALNLKANLASPDLTGHPTAPTQAANSNNSELANTYYVDRALSTKADDASVVHKTGDETIANTKTFTGTYFGLPNIVDIGSGNNFVTQGGDGNLYKRSQANVINDLGISSKADDAGVVHKTLDESISGNKTWINTYPITLPNLGNPAITGDPFLRISSAGVVYKRTLAESFSDLGAASQSALQDTAAALRASMGSGTSDTIYTKGYIHVLDSAGVKQYVYGDTASATKNGGLLKEDWSTFNAKASTASPTFTGTITTPAINLSGATASTIASLDASKNLVSLTTATYPSLTELAYVKGVTSAIQTQLTAKAPLASPTFTGTPTLPTGSIATTQTSTDNSTKLATTAFVQANKLVSINAQTASYTGVLADGQKLVTMNNASANTFTVPLNSSVAYPIGTSINITQIGAGQTSIVATGGVTIQSPGGALKIRVQYSTATLIKTATDTWILMGDISL